MKHLLALAVLVAPFVAFGQLGRDQPRLEIARFFDRNADGHLDGTERKAARSYLSVQFRQGGRGTLTPASPGPRLAPADVRNYGPEVSLYDIHTLRTIFLQFENPDWEGEMVDFFNTDVRVAATMTVDGKTYPNVGMSFRGHTSYNAIPDGGKRSFDVEMNYGDDSQRLLGFRSLNFLNANADPTMMRTFLYQYVARQYIPAPRANFVRVVINGESWGIYVNTEQIDDDLTRDQFDSTKGARWKIPGSSRGSGGMTYLGDSVGTYRTYYELKTKDKDKSWAALINACRILGTTPIPGLEKAAAPILDIDGALKFLAVDKALMNSDGYWTRSSDYYLYLDPEGKFHPIPWDANETWRELARNGTGAANLEPLTGIGALYRLVQVQTLRRKYLGYLRDIAENWLDWNKLGPLVAEMQEMLLPDMKTDPRAQYNATQFIAAATVDRSVPAGGYNPPPAYSLKGFADARRAYLLNHPAIKALSPNPPAEAAK